ncbi:hypothetical protein BDFB_011938, partial [Asbolus verrucosus]
MEKTKYDNSDKKSLNNLMETLQKLQNNAVKEKSNPSNPKDSGAANTSRKRTPDKRKRGKIDEHSPKITQWLNKENDNVKKSKCKKEKKDKANDSKLKPLDIAVNKVSEKTKSGRKRTKLERNSSFETYGIVIPSYEKILEDQKKFEEHKNQVKIFDAFDDKILEKSFNIECLKEVEKFSGDILDCKHLSLVELSDGFNKHIATLRDIMNEKKFSERHNRYHQKNKANDGFSMRDLRCSTSAVVFTQEQKDHMLDLMRIDLDPEDKLTNYFFQVLLPELCLLLFMDCHNMSRKKATSSGNHPLFEVVTSGFIRLLHDDGDDKRVHCYACSGYKECMHPTSKPCEGPLAAKEGPEKAMLQELGALPKEGLTHCISIAFWADDKPRMLRGCIPKKLGNEEACAKVEAMAGFENVECDICEGGADEGCNGPRVRRQEGEETTPAPAEVKTTVAEGNETAAPNETMPVTGSNDPGKDDGGGGGGGDGGD